MSRDSSRALSERARELLRAERTASEPEALQRRALARARVTFEAQSASRSETRSTLPAARRKPLVRVALLAAAAVSVAGIAAASAGWWLTQAEVTPVTPLTAPPTRVLPQPTTHAAPRTASAPARALASTRGSALSPRAPAPASAPARSVAAEVAKPPVARQYALELALLEPARSAVARGDYAGALTAASAHQREFPSGLLTEERSALRVRALWGLGRVSEANAAAAAFRQRYPRSALLAWMNQK